MYKNNTEKREINNNPIKEEIYPFEIIYEERKRIANDVHDSVIQNLVGIFYMSQECINLLDCDTYKAKNKLKKICKTTKDTISDTRAIIYNLKSFEYFDIYELVERYVNKWRDEWLFQVEVKVINEQNSYKMKPFASICMFRLVQEAMNNILKHSYASKVIIEIIYKEETIQIVISDNGIGISNDAMNKKLDVVCETQEKYGTVTDQRIKEQDSLIEESGLLGGYGLSIMEERVQQIGGVFNIFSEEKKGTRIVAEVPNIKVKCEENV